MATYILMTKLSPNVTKEMKKRETIGQAWKAKVKAKCPQVKFVSHYALLGPYDFMDIYEAPDQETAAKVAGWGPCPSRLKLTGRWVRSW